MVLVLMTCLNATIVGFVSLVLLCFFLLRRRSKAAEGREAPLATGALPIIGHLSLLSDSSQMPHKSLGALADKHGPLFTIKLGLRPVLVVSNWEMAKECYTTNDLAVSSRPRIVAIQHLSYNQAMFAFSPHGPYWRELRKISTLQLLSNRRIELLSHVHVSEVETCIKELFTLWCNEKKNENESNQSVAVELKKWFGELTLNVVLRVIAGKRYFGATAAEVTKEEGQRFQKALRDFFQMLGMFVVGDALPFLRWLDLGGHEKAMKQIAKNLDTILGEWLEEHRRKRVSNEVTEDRDFMDVMLSLLDGTELGGYDADTIVKSTVLILIGGGVDTSTVTITWAISLLLNNPHVLKEAQKELDIQIGKDRLVKESDISKLVYIQAIVKETLRLHPAAPLSGPREFTEDCTIAGYRVKRGTRLITNLWKIHTDPSIWADPLDFKPERFLTTHKDVDVRGHHFELIPFGSGRRICPGISFALQIVHLTLATFLQSFEITKPSNEPIDMTETFGLTNMKATPLDVFIKPRLSSKVYDAL